MIKKLFLFAMLVLSVTVVYGQTASQINKPRLGILPFAGGAAGEGELIATLFASQSEIMAAFTVVPRTAAVNALVAEQNFQLSGYTDSDTIASLGRMLNADFVVSGHIRSLGARSLVIATIVNVETFEQLAGVFREYRAVEEIPAMLPVIAARLIDASKKDTSKLPTLAVAPFNITSEKVDEQNAEVLAQILAIEIANTGEYAVLPRTSTIQAAMKELDFQMSGATADESAKAIGRAINAQYILSGQVGSIGAMNLFTAQILNVEDGVLLTGDSRNYREIGDGIIMMEELALLLTDRDAAAALITQRQREEAKREMFANPARLWSAGLSVGSAVPFEPILAVTLRGTMSPFKYCFINLGFDVGFLSLAENTNYFCMYPHAHIAGFLPLGPIDLYAGVGGGYFFSRVEITNIINDNNKNINTPVLDITAGLLLFDMIDISYSLRLGTETSSHKISLGYIYRFN